MPKQQQLERQRFEAARAAARQAPVDEEIAAQTEAMWTTQRQQEVEFTPPGTQFELTAPGSMPVRSQQRLVEEAPLPLRELLADYRQAMDESDLETANAVNLIGKKKYPGKWGKLRNEDDKRVAALRASQMNLDFEGAPSETQAEPVPGDQDTGRGAAVERPAVEPSVGMDEQPTGEAAPVAEPAPERDVGPAERPVVRRAKAEKPKRTALKETEDAVQEPSPAEVPARQGAEAGERVGREVYQMDGNQM
jgi:hypothetical protein